MRTSQQQFSLYTIGTYCTRSFGVFPRPGPHAQFVPEDVDFDEKVEARKRGSRAPDKPSPQLILVRDFLGELGEHSKEEKQPG